MNNKHLIREIDQPLFEEAKAAQEDGEKSYTVAKNLELSLVTVNRIFQSSDWSSFQKTFQPEEDEEEEAEIVEVKNGGQVYEPVPSIDREGAKLLPMQEGYFRSLVAKKYVENENLRETRDSLAGTIKSSWKMIRLLELRKLQLEKDIQQMETYIRQGTQFIESDVEK